MHSRIIQLTVEPLDKEAWISKTDYDDIDELVYGVDYVSNIDDEQERKASVEWLKDYLSNNLGLSNYLEFDCEKETILFKNGFKTAYFQHFYRLFEEAIKVITFQNFIENDYEMWRLENIVSPTHGFLICCEDPEDLGILREFVRYILKEEVTYYINGILDYHY